MIVLDRADTSDFRHTPTYVHGQMRRISVGRMLLTILTSLIILVAGVANAQNAAISGSKKVVGANIPALLGDYDQTAYNNAVDAYSRTTPGGQVRWCTIQWNWEYNHNFRGIDKQLDLSKSFDVQPVILLEPIHWTDPDHWVPDPSKFSGLMKDMGAIVAHIEARVKLLRVRAPIYQLLNEPAGRCISPGLGPKPGGSYTTTVGEWHPNLFPLMREQIKTLKALGVTSSRIASPSISCILDNNLRSVTELASANSFDWSDVGIMAVNIGGSASWARDPSRLDQCKEGFALGAKAFKLVLDNNPCFAGKRVMITEFYGGPARFGYDLNPDGSFTTDVTDICRAEIDAFQPYASSIIVWGARPGEADVPGDKWLFYGVFWGFMNWQQKELGAVERVQKALKSLPAYSAN